MADYPLPVFHFQVEWGGTKLGFSEVSGLTTGTEVIEYRDGTDPNYSKLKMPGLKKFSDITLKRGILPGDNDFADWLLETKMNVPERRDLTISLLNENHEPVMSWKIKAAWPSNVEGPSLNSTGNEAAVESITLSHEECVIENG